MKKEPAAGLDTLPAASPYKSAAEELEALRKTLRLACQHYAKRIDMEIIRLRERVAGVGGEQAAAEAKGKAFPGGSGQFHDLRDAILEVKPLAGRRKDLKKIESLVDELRLLLDRWE